MPIPTPEQTQQLVDHFGSQSAAACALGASRRTIQYWLRPDDAREYDRNKRANDPEWAEKQRERKRKFYQKYYDNLDGVAYNRMLLRKRREQALKRIEQRQNKEV